MSIDVLLDTHVVLWFFAGSTRMSDAISSIVDDDASTVTVSEVSFVEVAIKRSLGKLDVDVAELRRHVRAHGMLELPIGVGHADSLQELPLHHRDPFDRILIAQALAEEMTIVTVDRDFAAYEGLSLLVA